MFQVLALFSIQGQEWFVAFEKENPTYNGTNVSDYYKTIFDSPSEVSQHFSISLTVYIRKVINYLPLHKVNM